MHADRIQALTRLYRACADRVRSTCHDAESVGCDRPHRGEARALECANGLLRTLGFLLRSRDREPLAWRTAHNDYSSPLLRNPEPRGTQPSAEREP